MGYIAFFAGTIMVLSVFVHLVTIMNLLMVNSVVNLVLKGGMLFLFVSIAIISKTMKGLVGKDRFKEKLLQSVPDWIKLSLGVSVVYGIGAILYSMLDIGEITNSEILRIFHEIDSTIVMEMCILNFFLIYSYKNLKSSYVK